MYYTEYATAAITHYKSCKYMYDCCVANSPGNTGAQSDFLYRLYYLCGHIVECVSIYLIYDHFRYEEDNPNDPNWNSQRFHHLHRTYNPRFTKDAHIDFYPVVVNSGFIKFRLNSNKQYKVNESLSNKPVYFCVQKHKFQEYVKGIIWHSIPLDIPYLGRNCQDDAEYEDAICLLDNWNSDLRYYYEGRHSGAFFNLIGYGAKQPKVNSVTIANLLRLCEKIIGALYGKGRQI